MILFNKMTVRELSEELGVKNPTVPSIVLRKFDQPPARLLLEQRRVQVAAGTNASAETNAIGGSERWRKAKRFLAGA